MDRSYHSAYAQHAGGTLYRLIQQSGFGYYRTDHNHTNNHHALDLEAAETDAGDDRSSAED